MIQIIVALSVLLAGCAPKESYPGYMYHDANHGPSPSPPQWNHANHGTWLWPPAERQGL